jgi:coenzyme F420 hydrogenase subunit beta
LLTGAERRGSLLEDGSANNAMHGWTMTPHPATVKSIVEWQLCLGCGACAYICPGRKISLRDAIAEGIRPVLSDEACGDCHDCLDVCPAYRNDHRELLGAAGLIPELETAYGPVLEVWEGYAEDPEIRWSGASGGVLTAIALYCLEQQGMHGVLHVCGDPDNPVRNRTRLSRSRAELLAATGSRYGAASACDALQSIEEAPTPCVFIGQPSEVTAVRKAAVLRPRLRQRVGLALSFFCAGSPATQGTEELLRSEGIAMEDVSEVRYRGLGWPGSFSVRRRGAKDFSTIRSYEDSWAFLQRFRPPSVHLTPDGSGEDADISCGDPWYRSIGADERGRSLVLVRTDRGRQILRDAARAGYVHLEPADARDALNSQVNLIRKRGAIWGRLLIMRLCGQPVPHLAGFSLLYNWARLPLQDKLRSTLGTARRIVRRRRERARRRSRRQNPRTAASYGE